MHLLIDEVLLWTRLRNLLWPLIHWCATSQASVLSIFPVFADLAHFLSFPALILCYFCFFIRREYAASAAVASLLHVLQAADINISVGQAQTHMIWYCIAMCVQYYNRLQSYIIYIYIRWSIVCNIVVAKALIIDSLSHNHCPSSLFYPGQDQDNQNGLTSVQDLAFSNA